MASFKGYDLVVVGTGFAGTMATLNFLEECERSKKNGRVALVEVGKEGERSGASKWTMAYLRLDKNLDFGRLPSYPTMTLPLTDLKQTRTGSTKCAASATA